MMEKHCSRYCGVACVDGSCPIALSEEYAEYGCDTISSCEDCWLDKGCEDCCFEGTDVCIKEAAENGTE